MGITLHKERISQKKQTNPKMQLTYFNIRGRGEFARLILAAAEVEYDDKRIEFAEWPAYKAKTPLGFLPVLKDGDKEISQTMSIVRYLGRKYDLYGKDISEQTQIDMLLDTIADLTAERMKVFGVSDKAEQEKMIEAIKTEGYKPHFERIEKLIEKKGGWVVGSSMSIADLVLFHSVELNGVVDKVASYPGIAASRTMVSSHPIMKQYLKNRVDSWI